MRNDSLFRNRIDICFACWGIPQTLRTPYFICCYVTHDKLLEAPPFTCEGPSSQRRLRMALEMPEWPGSPGPCFENHRSG